MCNLLIPLSPRSICAIIHLSIHAISWLEWCFWYIFDVYEYVQDMLPAIPNLNMYNDIDVSATSRGSVGTGLRWLSSYSFCHLLKCSTLWISWFPDNFFRILVYIMLGKVYPYTISTFSIRAGYLSQECIQYIACFKWTFNDWICINCLQYIQTLDRSTKWEISWYELKF